MKAKAIEKLLSGVMNKVYESLPEYVISCLKRGYITGGCIPSMLTDQYVNDFDLYLSSKEDVDTVLNYYKEHYLVEQDGNHKIYDDCILITDNAITLKDHKVQIITKYYGMANEVITKFDFAHICSVFYLDENQLIITTDTYRLILEKDLIYTGSEYPLSSLLRTRKYLKKGWNISAANMVKIMMDVCAIFARDQQPRFIMGTDPYIPTPQMEDPNYVFDEADRMDMMNNIVPKARFVSFEDEPFSINVDTLISQLNGVDPITIQRQLLQHTGQRLSISEIIELLNEN